MMKLYCYACNKPHDFTLAQIERILYCLQGALGDAITAEAQRLNEGCDCVYCLELILEVSHESEGYADWTNSLVADRKTKAKQAA